MGRTHSVVREAQVIDPAVAVSGVVEVVVDREGSAAVAEAEDPAEGEMAEEEAASADWMVAIGDQGAHRHGVEEVVQVETGEGANVKTLPAFSK